MNRKVLAGIFVVAIIGLFAFRNISDKFVMKRSFTEAPTGSVYIIVDKSDYELQIYDEVGGMLPILLCLVVNRLRIK